MALDLTQHPCFNSAVRHRTARIHLPVAPRCNLQCNYCNRQFDCVNESRPGVTSAVLNPRQALHYLERAMERVPNIRVVGIAGPGDPFACPEETLETLALVRERFPDMLLCVASNGLAVEQHVEELARLKISHVTLTVNAVDVSIGSRIYAWARSGYRVLRKEQAAAELFGCQERAIVALKSHGIVVKINTVMIPGINDAHVVDVARAMASLGADVMNCVPCYPVKDTPFEELGAMEPKLVAAIRHETSRLLPQMVHCTRCRADAAGVLGVQNSEELDQLLRSTANGAIDPGAKRPYVAVASREGRLINEHLGEAVRLWIFEPAEEVEQPRLVNTRDVPKPGGGAERWHHLAEVLGDCGAVFVNAAGESPKRVLEQQGIRVLEATGLVADALGAYTRTGELPRSMRPAFQGCGRGCAGSGMGCG